MQAMHNNLQAVNLAKHAAHVCPWVPLYSLDLARAIVLYDIGKVAAARRIAVHSFTKATAGRQLNLIIVRARSGP